MTGVQPAGHVRSAMDEWVRGASLKAIKGHSVALDPVKRAWR